MFSFNKDQILTISDHFSGSVSQRDGLMIKWSAKLINSYNPDGISTYCRYSFFNDIGWKSGCFLKNVVGEGWKFGSFIMFIL